MKTNTQEGRQTRREEFQWGKMSIAEIKWDAKRDSYRMRGPTSVMDLNFNRPGWWRMWVPANILYSTVTKLRLIAHSSTQGFSFLGLKEIRGQIIHPIPSRFNHLTFCFGELRSKNSRTDLLTARMQTRHTWRVNCWCSRRWNSASLRDRYESYQFIITATGSGTDTSFQASDLNVSTSSPSAVTKF